MDQRDDWHLTDMLTYDHGRGDPFAAAVRATRMPMVITDPSQDDNPIVFCNEAFQKLTGYERGEIVGRNCRFLQGPDTDRDDVRRVREAIEAGHDVAVDLLNYRKDGTTFWNALYLSPVRDDGGTIRFYFASQLDVTDRIEAQRLIARQKQLVEEEVAARTADLEAALTAKTLLLHEVDHRVKNNLTMIGSLLRLQARNIDAPEVAAKLNAMLERIDALAAVHRQLYQSADVTRFDMGAFVETLVVDVIGSAGRSDTITLVSDVSPIEVESRLASSLGLVVNEIATNAIKHAYAAGRAGRLQLTAGIDGDVATIRIADDGPGMADTGEGLGSMLIRRLSRQVGASVTWDAVEGAETGTAVTVTFPVTPAIPA